MQQGMLSSVILCSSLLFGTTSVVALEMQPEKVELLLQDEQVQKKVSALLQNLYENKLDSLKFSLERIALPQQEAARYLLLKTIEEQNLILTPRVAIFVERQKSMIPTYEVFDRGEGYEFSVPAFNYPAIASRLLKRWKQDQSTLDFVLKAERGELQLKTWLSGSRYQVQAREALLIKELDSLSYEAVAGLTAQLTDEAVTSWLPSSVVMVKLAQISENADLYKILWRMRADFNSQGELSRLAQTGNSFAVQQIIQASFNPSLKQHAIKALAQIKPLPEEAKVFLIEKMAVKDEALMVARELANQGYRLWLQELANDNQTVRRSAILNALAQ
ncbi:hypothetical protein ACFFUP_19080 [Vibrio ostreicida]|uniref:HEAT repeat domain-containing protein n=1 Tax=Vibrio ostreicida TaxID=526588 RepID=A0ABT8BRK7_9VIBR|nr:hypothetical protein [Vibrio ostreicida]MDN3608752.1 hypothetical protein [Vibrio ostreicida]NPD10568.1 hypothetical protein [Vibrio ostreicida]